jgi:Na+-transporting NADH:ubiquinone oxidoreductase subunit D
MRSGKNNPISKQVLGICSALAVTVQMNTAIVMALALTFVVAFSQSDHIVMRNAIPRNIRIIVEVAVIATLVIIADEVLKAFLFNISKQLSVFVGLIITNCIVMGRAETFAMSNPPGNRLSRRHGQRARVRVDPGRGLLFPGTAGIGKAPGLPVVPQALAYDMGYMDMGLMLLAPGAFIVIGLFVWLEHALLKE